MRFQPQRAWLNDRYRNLRGYSAADGTWRRVPLGIIGVLLTGTLGAVLIAGGGSPGRDAPASSALVASSRHFPGWKEPDPTTTTASTTLPTPEPKPMAMGGKAPARHGCTPRSLDQIPANEDPSGDPHAVNPSSGAGGLWQIIPSTWKSNGGTQYAPTADQATPEQQRAVAQKIYNEQGTRPWKASGC